MKLHPMVPLAGLLIAVLGLGACSRPESAPTPGERLDSAIDKSKDAAQDAQRATGQAMDAAGTALNDSAITASVKTRLAADAELKMLDIHVETEEGRTVLTGTAPNAAARDRAEGMARAVDGVKSVDNRLEVKP